jgi:uncharacterized phage protein (TIGR02218 family)
MPRSLSPELDAHLEGPVTSLAMLWRIERLDGGVLGMTSHDQDITFDSLTYKASSAVNPSTLQAQAGGGVDSTELAAVLEDARITREGLLAGIYDGAEVTLFVVNWADLTMGAITLMRGTIGEVSLSEGAFQAEVRGLLQAARANVTRRLTLTCQVAEFGDAECGVDLEALTFAGEVDLSGGRRSFTSSDLIGRTESFKFGKVTWTSGANAGSSRPVASLNSTTGAVDLMIPAGNTIEAGDEFTISAGCDRSLAACKGYSNVLNFRGFPTVPGTDAVLRAPKS